MKKIYMLDEVTFNTIESLFQEIYFYEVDGSIKHKSFTDCDMEIIQNVADQGCDIMDSLRTEEEVMSNGIENC